MKHSLSLSGVTPMAECHRLFDWNATALGVPGTWDTSLKTLVPLLQTRRHELTTRIGAGTFSMQGDFHRLVQIVSNLLTNAAKYTPQGGLIEIGLNGESSKAQLTVTDNGVGIAPDILEQVFDLFTQAERTPDRSQGGLGIGLALVRSLVQLHGGQVLAKSAGLHQGSTFLVELPMLAGATTEIEKNQPRAQGATRRILVVDDNVDAATLLAEVLQITGHTVEIASDAQSAIAKASNGAQWNTYILDIGLPDMTGYELAQRLRQMPAIDPPVFIALTGYGQAHDRVISKASGFDHHLVKPADIDQLLALLAPASD